MEEPLLIPEAGEDPWFLIADAGSEVDGIEIKARQNFASKAIDWRGRNSKASATPA